MTYRFLLIISIICTAISPALAGECLVKNRVCVDGPSEKDIRGFRVFRECWRWIEEKECRGFTKNNCEVLRKAGCTQAKSKCIDPKDKWCLGYAQSFICRVERIEKIKEKRFRISSDINSLKDKQSNLVCENGEIRCLDGSCFKEPAILNDEAALALSHVSALKEMQNSLKDPLSVFNGTARNCKISWGGLKNCCKAKASFMESAKLSACQEGEKDLAKRQNDKLCTYLGAYKKGKLIKKKYRSYCCYHSKLARIIQEQARKQIGKSQGDAKNPDCSGLTPEELQRIDFSELNLREFYGDVLKSQKTFNIEKITKSIEAELVVIQDSLNHPKKGAKLEGTAYHRGVEGTL